MAEITEELRVLVTAEVEKAVRNLKSVDKQTDNTTKMFEKLGKSIASAMSVKAMISFASKSYEAFRTQKEAVSVLESVLKSTGATAWTSSEQLQEMATSLQNITNYGDETILSMHQVLLGFKNIKGDNFEHATKAILDMSTVMKMDLSSAAQVVGKALDDPINGLDSLRRQGFFFTEQQKKMLQSMVESGDIMGAQKIILEELDGSYGGAAKSAADMVTQIKNSIGDLYEGYGQIFAKIGEKSGILKTFSDSINFLNDALVNYEENAAKVFGGEIYEKWFNSLSDTKKLEEALSQLEAARKKLNESHDMKDMDVMDYWQDQVQRLTTIVQRQQDIQDAEEKRKKAESDINDLMLEISKNYDKLSKDDPTVQLQNYQKELEKIGEQRKKLLESAVDSNGNLIDTSGALKQLDYVEKKIREKMKDLQDDGKKSWKNWLSEITEIEESSFTGGKDAAEIFLKQLDDELSKSEKISELLGEKFDMTEALESQRDKIKTTLESLFSIDPTKIDESFKSDDNFINELVKRYKKLSEEIEKSKNEQKNWKETFHDSIVSAMADMDGLNTKAAEIVVNMGEQFASISLGSALSGIKELGKALGEGKNASDSMKSALENMATEILNQLPTLFMQAGLQLIAEGMWPLGLGLLAAAGVTGLTAGIVEGQKSSVQNSSSSGTKANALGGVYGDSSYRAFAKGGAFTNRIINEPTYFRFAKGSGFGTGLMGEAGPEAIMPLTRGADGSLGVSASGIGCSDVQVNVPVTVYSDEPVEVHDGEDENGQRKIEILVGSMINQHISNGKADKALKSRYGLKVQGV